MLYVDNPVGAGFSFTEGGYCKNQTQIGEEVYEALRQFFIIFPEIVSNDFFISGESYGGKYSIAVAHTIHKKNPTAHSKINLKGISCGNGVVDPEHEVYYAEYYYQLGLIDFNTKKVIEKLEMRAAEKIHKHEYKLGLSYMTEAVLSRHSIFAAASGFEGNFYNLLSWNHTVNNTNIEKFLARADIRVALHVGNRTFQDGGVVMEHLLDEMMVSLAPLMIELLNHYRVLVYSGQLDLIVPYPITLNYLRHLNFSSVEEYKTAKRSVWRIEEDIAGYVKKAGNLTEVMVRNAGHMAIHDQPSWLYYLFRQFFRNKSIV
ncbi:hypothetical protein WA026_017719 [Henosepilachna vigintioctopunctata]|uniref:Carboxypeptidase n=1 Tax=Henosepilachna vigintioctopunctata TaxID=420089 RepID=A0AAW1UAM8_9CUCU